MLPPYILIESQTKGELDLLSDKGVSVSRVGPFHRFDGIDAHCNSADRPGRQLEVMLPGTSLALDQSQP